MNPYQCVIEFEKLIAEWCGAKYGVAVDSNSNGIFLSLMWRKSNGGVYKVSIPPNTYPSIPCSIIHAGGKVNFLPQEWHGEYQLSPLNIWDAALRFKKGMYHGGLQVISFHVRKHLPLGRGGMVLTDDEKAANWLRKARFDGRNPVPLKQDNIDQLGWNCYMQPSEAAWGIQLFEVMRQKYPDGMEDLKVGEQGYSDLSKFSIYTK